MKPQTKPWLTSLLAALFLAGCAAVPSSKPAMCPCPAEVTPPVAPPAKPLQAASWADLPGWQEDDQKAAWAAFLQSCRGLKSTARWPLWRATCEAAPGVAADDNAAIRQFLESRLTPYRVTNPDGSTTGLITGYYEPLLRGARQHSASTPYPVLPPPDDLLTIDLGELHPELKSLRLRGRLQGHKVVPYWSRAELAGKEEKLASKALAWVEDAVELFFLQIQGSGRIQMTDGKQLRVGYADQNGHPYQSIGKVLLERGELKPGEATMQGIQAWARANPAKLPELLNTNPSYVFFRELPPNGKGNGDGPIGALGVPLTAERSVAVDPRSIPLGAPLFLASTAPNSNTPLNRLMLAQDTGGAIRGAVRADFFWGFGNAAGEQAGKMKQEGRLWVLLPPGVVGP
jgi:membrane-bound lytic murein transglycosylase A